MKLLNLLTALYVALTLLALAIGGFYVYRKLVSEIDFELGRELNRQIDAFAGRLEQGVMPEGLNSDRLEITQLPFDAPIEELYLRDTIAYHDPMNRHEKQLKASKSYKINGEHYRISYYNLVVETEDISETVVQTMLVVLLIQLGFIILFFRAFANRILKPFNATLAKVQRFDLTQQQPLRFDHSAINEFAELNSFLEGMSDKMIADYRQIKEFSENISHEVQTPSAVIRGKLEHLMNLEMTEDQAGLIDSIYQNNERINRIVRSLGFLARLENNEFSSSETVNIADLVLENLASLKEIAEIRRIDIKVTASEPVYVPMHAFVAETLVHNLLGNAIKHNLEGGWIEVRLTKANLWIQNSGQPSNIKPEMLVQRFKKDSKHHDSIGLGLAIVQQICRHYRFSFHYGVEGATHTITIEW
ncbi:sensor histidine kinase [Lunatimonas salinarum]|uniref:sensor histidine kinase n=1 Tax=Lunatimonas salinarum TaxID=1774590 RepID=UPI001ADFB042|nr:HAMP domain-containing sensor histidine kinase [Lunatimonas salinarum]